LGVFCQQISVASRSNPPKTYGFGEYDWIINQDLMQTYLSRLPHLERIAFSNDCYENERKLPDSFFESEDIEQPHEEDEKPWSYLRRLYHGKYRETKRCNTPVCSRN